MADEQVTTLGIDALASVHLQFHALAVGASDAETRDALLLAARLADRLSDLRGLVSDVIIRAETGSRPLAMVDAVRMLRAALDRAAKGED